MKLRAALFASLAIIVCCGLGTRAEESDGLASRIPYLEARAASGRWEVRYCLVGILGKEEDAPAIRPFAESDNDYVALGAAKALLRLGDRDAGIDALVRLSGRAPREHLYYVTEALHALREVEYHGYVQAVGVAIERVEEDGEIQPGWLGAFCLLAAEVEPGVWN